MNPPTNLNRPMNRKDALGLRGERAAAQYVTRLGWRILARNWRCREGELDLIAHDGRRHIVCEVKTRRTLAYGAPVEAITVAKAARLRRLAERWAAQHGVRAADIRIDVIGLVGDGTTGFAIDHMTEVC
jgi:putative endonuclease